jgi:hypothetical protein
MELHEFGSAIIARRAPYAGLRPRFRGLVVTA